jgi:hypothetical protein
VPTPLPRHLLSPVASAPTLKGLDFWLWRLIVLPQLRNSALTGGAGPPFDFADIATNEGAPSLRPLQGWEPQTYKPLLEARAGAGPSLIFPLRHLTTEAAPAAACPERSRRVIFESWAPPASTPLIRLSVEPSSLPSACLLREQFQARREHNAKNCSTPRCFVSRA